MPWPIPQFLTKISEHVPNSTRTWPTRPSQLGPRFTPPDHVCWPQTHVCWPLTSLLQAQMVRNVFTPLLTLSVEHICQNQGQKRPQSLRYPYSAEQATEKNGITKSWFRFHCACVKLFTHLTKRSSQGTFALLPHWYILVPKQFLHDFSSVHQVKAGFH